MSILFTFIKYFVLLLLILFILGFWRTWAMEHSPYQAFFLKGLLPNPTPDGLLKGDVPGYKLPWLGKKFDAKSGTGINLFSGSNGNTQELFPFKTYPAKGLKDKNLDVLDIDYNIPGNPFWLRLILDEIVQVAPGQYLGKWQLRIIPGFPFTLSFFELKQN